MCADQPKQGDICKLHDKENKSDSVEQTKENNNDDEKTCEYKKEQSEKEQSKIEESQKEQSVQEDNVKAAKPNHQLYVKEKMKTRKAKNIF